MSASLSGSSRNDLLPIEKWTCRRWRTLPPTFSFLLLSCRVRVGLCLHFTSRSFFLSGRADLARCYPLTASLNVRDALKEICLDAGTVISSPVFGFRPVRSARSRTRNVPSPVRCTSSPAASASVRTSTNELYIFSASFVLESAFSAILRTNSAFVILFSTGRTPCPPFLGIFCLYYGLFLVFFFVFHCLEKNYTLERIFRESASRCIRRIT